MEEKDNSKTRKTIILSLCVVTIVFACILGTYAYFMVNISNNNRQEVQLDTGTMRLRFADGNPTINQTIMLGETITKTFTIENTGDLDASLSIEWLDIVNSYMEGSLTYTLEQSETQDSGYEEIISKTNVPVTDTAFTTTLVPDIEVPQGKTYYYNLKITFNDLVGIDQEADRNAKLTTKFTVSQPSNNRSYSLVIDPNGGTLGDTNTVQTLTKRNGTTETIGTPTKAGANFKGWKVIGMGSTLVDGTLTMGKTNTKVIAEWEEFDPREAIIAIENNRIPIGVNKTTDTTPDFAVAATSDEGVYSMEDDYGTSYFYRGAVTNNYVKFGKWAEGTENAGKDMYWRIIRVNGDGSVRIRYDGTIGHKNNDGSLDRFAILDNNWNELSNDNKYVGWMYGPADKEDGTMVASTSKEEAQTNTVDSKIKTVVDEWYKTNIADQGYGQYIADAIFCNDRSTPGSAATGWDYDTGLGYGANMTGYGAYARNRGFKQKPEPILICPQKNDAFTVDDTTKGNGALTYPVGLITEDEVTVAGGGKIAAVINTSYYLYNPSAWSWTFSPLSLNATLKSAVFGIKIDGRVIAAFLDGKIANTSGYVDTNSDNKRGTNPVINLTPDYFKTLIGDGTMGNPFRAE